MKTIQLKVSLCCIIARYHFRVDGNRKQKEDRKPLRYSEIKEVMAWAPVLWWESKSKW